MPTYFSISFELNKSQTAVKEFCAAVIDAGLVFKSGYWGFENDSFDDIVAWNQNKLDNNFQLGYTEHYSHNFKQMLFDFSDFTEVRLFIMNDKKSSTFEFHLIIPEDDFVEWTKTNGEYIPHHKFEKMNLLKTFAKILWNSIEILAIQTAWECSDYPPKAKHISSKTKPQIEPFCIIRESSIIDKLGLPFEKVGQNGVLIEDYDNWNYL